MQTTLKNDLIEALLGVREDMIISINAKDWICVGFCLSRIDTLIYNISQL